MQRVEIFHQRIKEEKEKLSGVSTYITIHRERMLEDGYQQLGLLSSSSLKGTVKVKFVNVQVHLCVLIYMVNFHRLYMPLLCNMQID